MAVTRLQLEPGAWRRLVKIVKESPHVNHGDRFLIREMTRSPERPGRTGEFTIREAERLYLMAEDAEVPEAILSPIREARDVGVRTERRDNERPRPGNIMDPYRTF